MLWHVTFTVNSLAHVFGRRVYDTPDTSRNTLLVAIATGGEGWHNNHHRYQRAARNGFYWWEFDPTWYTIRTMAALGLAWDVQRVPTRIYEEARAIKALRPRHKIPSIIDAIPRAMEFSEDAESV